MSVDISSWVWKHSPTKGSTRLVLLSLSDQANDQGICWPSIASVAQRCRMSRRYAQRLLKELEDEGHIEIIHRFDDERGVNKSNMYRIRVGVGNNRPLPLGGKEQETPTPGGLETPTPSEQETPTVVVYSSPEPSLEPSIEPLKPSLHPDGRKRTQLDELKRSLENYFSEITGNPLPLRTTKKQQREAAVRWWNPLTEIASWFNGNSEQAKEIIADSVAYMRGNGLTVSSPASILEVARSKVGELKQPGGQYVHPSWTQNDND